MAIASNRLFTTRTQSNRTQATHFPSATPASGAIDLAMLALNDRGVIQNCCPTCEQVFGYRSDELAGRHVSTLLPELIDKTASTHGSLFSATAPFRSRRGDAMGTVSPASYSSTGSASKTWWCWYAISKHCENTTCQSALDGYGLNPPDFLGIFANGAVG
jgi:hypothetical protein